LNKSKNQIFKPRKSQTGPSLAWLYGRIGNKAGYGKGRGGRSSLSENRGGELERNKTKKKGKFELEEEFSANRAGK
jgi:hypothetical protein